MVQLPFLPTSIPKIHIQEAMSLKTLKTCLGRGYLFVVFNNTRRQFLGAAGGRAEQTVAGFN
jgi:hypothetical protein